MKSASLTPGRGFSDKRPACHVVDTRVAEESASTPQARAPSLRHSASCGVYLEQSVWHTFRLSGQGGSCKCDTLLQRDGASDATCVVAMPEIVVMSASPGTMGCADAVLPPHAGWNVHGCSSEIVGLPVRQRYRLSCHDSMHRQCRHYLQPGNMLQKALSHIYHLVGEL